MVVLKMMQNRIIKKIQMIINSNDYRDFFDINNYLLYNNFSYTIFIIINIKNFKKIYKNFQFC